MTSKVELTREEQLANDAWLRYQDQVALVKALKAKWVRLKKPVTTLGGATGRSEVIHPLVIEIQDAEMKADRLYKSCLEKRKIGRPKGSTSAPDRQQMAPIARIRKIA